MTITTVVCHRGGNSERSRNPLPHAVYLKNRVPLAQSIHFSGCRSHALSTSTSWLTEATYQRPEICVVAWSPRPRSCSILPSASDAVEAGLSDFSSVVRPRSVTW